jgi:hypothetical protein
MNEQTEEDYPEQTPNERSIEGVFIEEEAKDLVMEADDTVQERAEEFDQIRKSRKLNEGDIFYISTNTLTSTAVSNPISQSIEPQATEKLLTE